MLKNLQDRKTKREFDAALMLAEKAIIYQQNPTMVMKRLSKLIHSKSSKRPENTKFADIPNNLSITAPIGKPKASGVLKLPKAQHLKSSRLQNQKKLAGAKKSLETQSIGPDIGGGQAGASELYEIQEDNASSA